MFKFVSDSVQMDTIENGLRLSKEVNIPWALKHFAERLTTDGARAWAVHTSDGEEDNYSVTVMEADGDRTIFQFSVTDA